MPNPDQRLLPGYPVEATVLAGSGEPVLAVPRGALVEDEAGVSVWVVGAGNVARSVQVQPGIHDDRWVAVQGDLSAGDSVVTLGQRHIVHPGQALLVVE